MKIDMHMHFFPLTLLEYIKKHGNKIDLSLEVRNGQEYVRHVQGFSYPLFKKLYDYEEMLRSLKETGIDMAVLSVQPGCFYYFLDKEKGLLIARLCNDWIAEFCGKHTDRFLGMATLPMQDIDYAVKELIRAHEELLLNAIEIGSTILNENLDADKFFPVYEYCNANNILIFIHPYYILNPGYVGFKENLSRYYNVNLAGNPFDTNMAINTMIFGGVFERFPNLKLLAAHGGGYFPYQFGRLMHGYKVRQEPKAFIRNQPEHYLKNIYFDTITHWQPALDFLVSAFGAGHVVIGTDYPFDMGDYDPLGKIKALRITESEREAIYQGNAMMLLGL